MESGRNGRLSFRALAPDIWRYDFEPPPGKAGPEGRGEGRKEAPVSSVIEPEGTPLELEVHEEGEVLNVRAGGPDADSASRRSAAAFVSLQLRCRSFGMRFLDGRGGALLADNPGDVDGLGRPFVPPLGFAEEDGRVVHIAQSFALAPDERIFGLGEKFTRLDKAGQRIASWNVDALGSTSERSHKNIPFLWTTRGYGFLAASGGRATWDLGTESTQSWTLRLEDGALRAYVVHGQDPARILELYGRLTGKPPLPPKWSFGLWMSSGGTYRDQAAIERLLDGILANALPASVVHIDPWWLRWRRYCDFVIDPEAFPRFQALIDRIQTLGLKLCLWEHPYLSVESELFGSARDKGYLVRKPGGEIYVIDYGLSLAPRPDGVVRAAGRAESWNAPVAIIDLTNPDAAAWFKDLHRPLLRMGVDVFKTDFGEDVPVDAVFADGSTGRTMHNLYPLLYNRAVFEVTEEERGRGAGIVWGRSGTAGSQRYPVCWSGDPAADFESLAATIRGGLSAGMSGLAFWTSDIGGYRGRPDPELYVRWAQFGLFSSHSRMHGDGPREPWAFGAEALRIVKACAELRFRLFPYIYGAAHEAARTGLPVIRALPLAFPDDPLSAAAAGPAELEYMFGPSLLVAPVYERGGRRAVYLPPGTWIDFWSGRRLKGPATLKLEVPLDRIPVYVKAGAIIPMIGGDARVLRIPEGRIDPLAVDVYPGAPSESALFEDEGATVFRREETKTKIVLSWEGQARRRWILRFPGIGRPSRIRIEAAPSLPANRRPARRFESGTLTIGLPPARSGRVEIVRS
jgi:alpha-D-xyloside xylohydrolase